MILPTYVLRCELYYLSKRVSILSTSLCGLFFYSSSLFYLILWRTFSPNDPFSIFFLIILIKLIYPFGTTNQLTSIKKSCVVGLLLSHYHFLLLVQFTVILLVWILRGFCVISHVALAKLLQLKLNLSVFHVASDCALET